MLFTQDARTIVTALTQLDPTIVLAILALKEIHT